MHDEHSLILENHRQFIALRELMFLLWEFEIMDNYTGSYLLDEVDWMWGSSQRLKQAEKDL
jgi:hypothetical protein